MVAKITSDWLAVRNIKKLKEERENMGLSQSELGKAVGLSGSIICGYESETKTCTVTSYSKLADFFHWDRFVANRPRPTQNTTEKTRELTLGFDSLMQEAPAAKAKAVVYLSPKAYNAVKEYTAKSFAKNHTSSISSTIAEAVNIFLAVKGAEA